MPSSNPIIPLWHIRKREHTYIENSKGPESMPCGSTILILDFLQDTLPIVTFGIPDLSEISQ